MPPGGLCNFLSKCNNNTWFFAFGFTIIEADRCPASLRAWHRLSRDHRKRRIKPISIWKQELSDGVHTARLASLYCCAPEQTPAQAARYEAVLNGLEATFGTHAEAGLYSAPGRTEIGGNHTDHQHGRVLAGSVNIDMLPPPTA